jgi:hypothetical protein
MAGTSCSPRQTAGFVNRSVVFRFPNSIAVPNFGNYTHLMTNPR